jgi:hypothetical protein
VMFANRPTGAGRPRQLLPRLQRDPELERSGRRARAGPNDDAVGRTASPSEFGAGCLGFEPTKYLLGRRSRQIRMSTRCASPAPAVSTRTRPSARGGRTATRSTSRPGFWQSGRR